MSDKFPATGEPIIAPPLSDNDLDRVSGGTLDGGANLQTMQMQQQMHHESQTLTAASNLMKLKQDTDKNTIDNMK